MWAKSWLLVALLTEGQTRDASSESANKGRPLTNDVPQEKDDPSVSPEPKNGRQQPCSEQHAPAALIVELKVVNIWDITSVHSTLCFGFYDR